MSPTKVAAFRIEAAVLAALRRIEHADGIPVAEQVRRALGMWLTSKGITPPPPAHPLRAKRKRG